MAATVLAVATGRNKAATGAGAYSTGAVARLCGVAPRTVAKWVDSGLLRAYRLPGGSRDRRVPHEALAGFLEANGMYDALARIRKSPTVLIVGDDALAEALGPLVPGVRAARDPFEAGEAVADRQPSVVILCGTLGRAVCALVSESLAKRTPAPAVVVLAPEDWPRESWQALGATHVLQRPVPVARLAKLLGRGEG